MEPVKLLERAAGGAAHALRHPIASAAYAAGLATGLAGAGLRAVTGRGQDEGPARPQVVPQRPAPVAERDVPPVAPTPLGEQFATEPKATSRQSEHGGPGNDAEIDDWEADALDEPDVDVEAPVGDEPLLDPAVAKAIRSEAAMMQKAADPDRG
jgi:hypothetical protein